MMENKRKINGKKCSKNIRKYCREYCEYTGIHGLRYFGEKRSMFEKICWFVVFVTSLMVCIAVIYKVYKKWQFAPIMVNFSSDEKDINEIPFPAVTICGEVRVSKEHFNYSHVLKNLVEKKELKPTELKHLQYMSLLCAENKIYCHEIPNVTTIDEEFYTFLAEGKTPFFDSCVWMGKDFDCNNIFRPIVTDEGLCYTFNMLEPKDIFNDISFIPEFDHKPEYPTFSHQWSVDYGYAPDAGVDTYPRRALLAGSTNSLVVNMYINPNDIDYACTSFQGFQIVLHQAVRYPLVQTHYFRVPMRKAIVVAITPVQMISSDDVKEYVPEKRECYMQGEKDLKFFSNYSQNNCQLECISNYTKLRCGCVAFYMPRETNTPICGNGNRNCMKQVRNSLDWRKLHLSITSAGNNYNECGCLPMCTMLDYETEITEIEYDRFKEYEAVGISKNGSKQEYAWSQLVIYFKKVNFIPHVRSELYGHLDFLSNVGGLLGLFIGFSLLSLFEIIYFMTIRIFCNMKLFKHWSGDHIQ
ncbi:pickpocket protein 28-like isoform X1 [Diabrotica virgifera virgifera]|uniref:Pickpocket protein 28-like n=1 Tax=Diabrotica virgifera virgifera TaxID=50390 RepID=A0ABM5KVS3_DIAVI|nr:pickpocket protein 28-like isoform X1 [Diabrotica virgifera virgifera]